MGGDSKTTTSTFTSQPGVKDVLGTAKTVFDSGIPWQPDTSSHVTPFSKQTVQGLSGLQGAATGAVPAFRQNFNRISSTLADGGLNDLQDQQVGRLQGIAGGNGLNAEQQSALDLLRPIATGSQVGGNPYLDDVIRRSSDDIANSTNLAASAAGRYGSGAHEGVLADAVGDMSSNLRYQDYGNQQARQDAAIQNLFGFGTTGQTQRNDAIGSLFNAGTQQRQNVLAGTQQLQDAYNAGLSPYRTMLDVGQQYEGLQSRVLQDQARILQERKNALTDPVNWLANLAGAFQGGQQVQTQRTTESPFSNPLFTGLLGKVLNI